MGLLRAGPTLIPTSHIQSRILHPSLGCRTLSWSPEAQETLEASE